MPGLVDDDHGGTGVLVAVAELERFGAFGRVLASGEGTDEKKKKGGAKTGHELQA